ncbi:(2Fe-2S)-binding protein [Aliikangiella maris]|uniref:Bacterioferritin-associated ferredoxin n=2 Tax=Aliikangiella maris TaxID=3162458 RepID=A0ABV2BU74_9GAMM
MYVCICNAVTDSQIKEAMHNGLTTFAEIQHHLGVGNCCGRCVDSAKAIVNEFSAQNQLTTQNQVINSGVQKFIPQFTTDSCDPVMA